MHAWIRNGMAALLAVTATTAGAQTPTTSTAATVDLKAAPAVHGWQIGLQTWTYNRLTLVDSLRVAAELGIDVVEFYPGQRFSDEHPFGVDHRINEEQRQLLLDAAKEAGVRLISHGVANVDAAEWPQLLAFAEAMGLDYISTEPNEDQIPQINEVIGESRVKLSIHNHPRPSHYWDPDVVLRATEGMSAQWGATADTGHWVRSGLDPLESLAKLRGRIHLLHFKDLNTRGANAHDVPWGTGVNNVYAAMAQLKEQGFRGPVIVEYEYPTERLTDEVRQSIDYFRIVSATLDEEGWEPLFAEDLSNAIMAVSLGWVMEDGVLSIMGGGDLWTAADDYGDFILDLEFRNEEDTNSGVFIRCDDTQDWLNRAIEIQISQPATESAKEATGAIFDIAPAEGSRQKPAGEWNRMTIIARGPMIYSVLNGAQVMCANLDEWTEAGRNPDGTPNKFRDAYAQLARKGRIGLQDHGTPVSFRNVRIKRLP